MRVLQLNSVCGVGSTGRIAVDLYDVLESRGHECMIAYGRNTAPERVRTIKVGDRTSQFFHLAATRMMDNHGFMSDRATQVLIRQIEDYDPDVIHLHNIHGYYLHVGMLFEYLKKAGKPVVWTLHDCWPFTGHCAYFDYVECQNWKSGCYECPQKDTYPVSKVMDNSTVNYIRKKSAFSGLDDLTIVTPSHWLANLVKESFLSSYPVKVIPNGIDLDTFRPVGSGFKKVHGLEGKVMILGVANIWERRKGLSDLVELSNRLKEDEVIVIVGVTEEQKKNLPESIIGITRTDSVADLVKIYSAADVFVNPTYEDNFPTTNLEALACGTPVITYDTGGSPESLDRTSGIVVPKGDMDALQRAVEVSRNDGFSGEACRQRAQMFDKTSRYQEYVVLQENIVSKRKEK